MVAPCTLIGWSLHVSVFLTTVSVAATLTPAQSYGTNKWTFFRGSWNLKAAFADNPPGAYLEMMNPLIFANYITYKSNYGNRYDPFLINASIIEPYASGGHWERLYAVESSREKGAHMRAFVDADTKRAILSFRGACFDQTYASCVSDMHVGQDGNPTPQDYIDQAIHDVEVAHAYLHDYAILVTGHSLGAQLAHEVGSRLDLDFQVVTFNGQPFPSSKKQTSREMYAVFDAIDLGRKIKPMQNSDSQLLTVIPSLPSVSLPENHICVYAGLDAPRVCQLCAARFPEVTPFEAMVSMCETVPPPPGKWKSECHDAVHWIDHFIEDLFPAVTDGRTFLPTCISGPHVK